MTSVPTDWQRILGSYRGRVILGCVILFLVLPLVIGLVWSIWIHGWKLAEGYALGVYIGTGIAVLWYTVETSYLRQAMVRANELAVLPIVVARIQSVQVGAVAGIGATYADKVVLHNVGKSAALFVRVRDFDVEETAAGTTYKRIEGVDIIEEGESVPVESAGYLGQVAAVNTLVPHLRPTAQTAYQVTILYEDIAGGQHESVMLMGQGGIRLLSHL